MEMSVSAEDVQITNNNGGQNSHGNNGRRVWIPRGRGNDNQNPNPNPNPNPNYLANPRSGIREKPIANPKPARNSNLDCISDINTDQNSNPTFISNLDSIPKRNANHHQSSNHSFHVDTSFNWNDSNDSTDIRNTFQGSRRYHAVGSSSQGVERTKKAGYLSDSKQIVGGNFVSSQSQTLQLAESSSVRSGVQSHLENQNHTARGQGRKYFDRNNLYGRVEFSSEKQNGGEIPWVATIDSNDNDHNDSYSEASNHESNPTNEDLVAPFNVGKKHSKLMQQQRQEIERISDGTSGKNTEWTERDDTPSTIRQDYTNKDIIDLSNEIKSSHFMQQQRGQLEDLGLGSTERNDVCHNRFEKEASRPGQNSSSRDLMLPLNDRKHLLQSIHNKRSEIEDAGHMNWRSSQDWRYHSPVSVAYARPLLKQESEEVTNLERPNLPNLVRPNLPNLVQEIEQKLRKSKVECMICFEIVGRSAAIWSCNSCYALFHLHCIRKWARAPTSTDLSAGQNQSSNWRCPGCQSVQYSRPEDLQYYCFCGKMQNPSKDFYLTPHSCGESCGKSLDKGKEMSRCPHSCILQCHPGPCPPCTAMAAPQPCPCGKKTITRRCSDEKSAESCGQVCEKLLTCGRHRCDKICHEGPCDSCTILINASCFCGKKEQMILCGDLELHGQVEWKSGVYACENLCMKMLSCQNHNCNLGCHPGECKECDLSPEKLTTCPCGKTPLLNQRKSCLDPVTTCSEVCEKILPCGKHTCLSSCHQDICPPCMVSVDQNCLCGSSSRKVSCWKITSVTEDNTEFLCEKVCGQKKNCGRHRCNEKCCPLSHRGQSDIQIGDWDPHLCLMPCGKKMRCGQHCCQDLCHSGHCPPCLETIFTDLSCACGNTSIPPPVPCGTPIPSCTYPCSIPQPCGHPATHNCHLGDCPPCTVSVAKGCVGSHVILRNVPCGSREIRCNKLCGKTRQCGMHACTRTCHLPPCDTVSMDSSPSKSRISCGQTCGASRRDCKHPCTSPCHPSSPCPDTRCTFPVTITCSCGRLTAQVPCDAGGNNTRSDPVFEASVYHKLPAPLQPVESHLTRVPMGQRKLACDDECAKLERKKTLANAFEISTTVDLPGVNGATSEMLADMIRREPQWVSAVEDRFKYLVLGRTKINTNIIRVHIFSAVPKEKRDILRLLAGRWNLSVFCAGWEPRRFIIVQVTQKSRAPARNLLLKGPLPTTGQLQPPNFNSLVDMDPRLVLSLFDLPRETDVSVSSLILRFGGECELVWLNDKNALAIFTDVARAATAMRRVDHATAYRGAVFVPQNGGLASSSAWGAKEVGNAAKENACKKKVQESAWMEDSWGEDWSTTDVSNSVWQLDKNPIIASKNPWGALEKESEGGTSYSQSEAPLTCDSSIIKSSTDVSAFQKIQNEESEVDDWEKAY